jgi:hypothetical protein
VRTWDCGGHSGGGYGVLLEFMYALLGLPAARLLVYRRVGVFAETGGRDVSQKACADAVYWGVQGPQVRARQSEGDGWMGDVSPVVLACLVCVG